MACPPPSPPPLSTWLALHARNDAVDLIYCAVILILIFIYNSQNQFEYSQTMAAALGSRRFLLRNLFLSFEVITFWMSWFAQTCFTWPALGGGLGAWTGSNQPVENFQSWHCSEMPHHPQSECLTTQKYQLGGRKIQFIQQLEQLE